MPHPEKNATDSLRWLECAFPLHLFRSLLRNCIIVQLKLGMGACDWIEFIPERQTNSRRKASILSRCANLQ